MFRRRAPPSVIYKFYGPDRADVFRSFQVRFSQVAALNDPFEFLIQLRPGDLSRGAERMAARRLHPISVVGMGLKATYGAVRKEARLRSAAWWLKALLMALLTPVACVLFVMLWPFISRQICRVMAAAGEDFEDLVLTKVRQGLVLVFSCSGTWNSVPMWAHYAGNHSGFALGLDPERAFADRRPSAKHPFLRPRKVRYLKREPKLNPRTLDAGDFITAKMDHWAYEQEWRFIAMPDDATTRGGFVGGHELLLFAFEPEAVREVIFAANCPTTIATAIVDSLSAAGLKPKLFQVRVSAGYGFQRVELSDLTELETASAGGGPLTDLRDYEFEWLGEALEGMRKDLEKDGFSRRLFVLRPPVPDHARLCVQARRGNPNCRPRSGVDLRLPLPAGAQRHIGQRTEAAPLGPRVAWCS
jgi:hypothetical protein